VLKCVHVQMGDAIPTSNKGHAHTLVAMRKHARYRGGFNPASFFMKP